MPLFLFLIKHLISAPNSFARLRETLGKKQKENLKEKRVIQRERPIDLSSPQILELMATEDRPLLLKEILRRLGLQKEQRHKAREYLKDLVEKLRAVGATLRPETKLLLVETCRRYVSAPVEANQLNVRLVG